MPIIQRPQGPFQAVPLTAFGDLRVAELSPIYQVSFESTVTNTEIGSIEVVGSGSVTQADAMCVVSTGTTTGSRAEWKTAHNAKYRAGFGGLKRFTSIFTAGVAGTEQMVGLADADGVSASHKNGYAVGYDGATFGFMRWQNDELFHVPQTAWDDPLDGTGRSGMTLDTTKINVWSIRYQYLGGGAVEISVEDDSTGSYIVAHTLLYANLNIVPSIYNPNFRLRAEARNGATTANLVVKSSSMAYFIEGKTKYTELQQPHFTSDGQGKSSVTAEVALFTIRNKATYAGKPNFIDILLEDIAGATEANSANNLASIRLVKNATLGGSPSYSDINTTNSVVDIDTSGTTVTGGKALHFFPMAGKNGILADGNITDHEMIMSPGDTVTVAGLSANSATMNAALLWRELF